MDGERGVGGVVGVRRPAAVDLVAPGLDHQVRPLELLGADARRLGAGEVAAPINAATRNASRRSMEIR